MECGSRSEHPSQELVATLLVVHREQPLPMACLFAGDGYTLLAGEYASSAHFSRLCPSLLKYISGLRTERKAWTLGQKWVFRWGDEEVQPAPDKWSFIFRLHKA